MVTAFYGLGVILIALTVVVAVFGGKSMGEVLSVMMVTFPVALVLFGMGKGLEILEGLEEKMESLENQIKGMNGTLSKVETKEDKGWKCTKCGRNNASYVGTCGCGRKRDDD